ncbi:hypothetical protein K457DRAFT_1823125 [Linnemannia elongata AG-77]|uniref:Uncharacterized protein n=1 Tax=Linnemannia elongata AG-77 TaxID=1314771 RepID=A0A197JLF9_9FUNG|nr:hypothetical protein K457DRAFT_1823125 [Linnemannia elongata AG-77]
MQKEGMGWDVSSLDTGMDVESGSDPLTSCLAVSPEGLRIVSVGADDKFSAVRDIGAGQTDFVLRGHTERVNATAISADGHWIATGNNDKTERLWDARSGILDRVLEGHTHSGTNLDHELPHRATAIISKFTSSSSYLDHNGTGTVLGEEKGTMCFCYCLIVQKAYVYDAAEDTNESVIPGVWREGSVHPEARGTNGAHTSCATLAS